MHFSFAMAFVFGVAFGPDVKKALKVLRAGRGCQQRTAILDLRLAAPCANVGSGVVEVAVLDVHQGSPANS